MLLQALYQYAVRHKLLEDAYLDRERKVSCLIDVSTNGEVRNVISLVEQDSLAQKRVLPRFHGEKGGRACFLADSCVAVFGFYNKADAKKKVEAGDFIPAPQPAALVEPNNEEGKAKDGLQTKSFLHFWQQVELAYERTKLPELQTLLKFRERYIFFEDGVIKNSLPFIEVRPSRTGKPEVGIKSQNGEWKAIGTAALAFRVEGKDVFDGTLDHPLTSYWRDTYMKEAWGTDAESEGGEHEDHEKSVGPSEEISVDETGTQPTRGVCMVSGKQDAAIASSHYPKILRIPDPDPKKRYARRAGGFIVSFAKQAPAFSSYGFVKGENAPTSAEAAAGYALALQRLLDSENNCLCVGPIAFCFWARATDEFASLAARLLKRATPKSARRELLAPLIGARDQRLRQPENFYCVALSGGKARVAIRRWLQTTIEDARENFKNWFEDLDVDSFGRGLDENADDAPALWALRNLAATTVRNPDKELDADAIVQLYFAALDNRAPSLSLAQLILARLQADLCKYGTGVLETPIGYKVYKSASEANQPIPPAGVSRMALLKLILNRNPKKGVPQMQPQVFETDDLAYNCGRLLAVLEAAQAKAHEFELKGAGIVEKFYASASTMPSHVFPYLLKLNRHHLRKIRRSERFGGDERFLEAQTLGLTALLKPQGESNCPEFPRQLDIHAQGRFALGFYQQKAADQAAVHAAIEARQNPSVQNNQVVQSIPPSHD